MNRRLFVKFLSVLVGAFSYGPAWASAKTLVNGSLFLLLRRSQVEKYFLKYFGLSLADIYWGDLHSHTNFSSDAQTFCGEGVSLGPADALIYARDVAGLDFVALTDHAELRSDIAGIAPNWVQYQTIMNNLNDEGAFIIFPGWEYTNTFGMKPLSGSSAGYGHKNVIFRDLAGLPQKMIGAFDGPLSNEIIVADTCADLWTELAPYYLPAASGEPATAATIIHTAAMNGGGVSLNDHQTDFDSMHASFVRSVEIYSKWGNGEGEAPAEISCSTQDTLIDYDAGNQVTEKTMRTLLYRKWVVEGNSAFILGFNGSTDNHMGQPANSALDQCGFPYRGGVTGIAVTSFSRNALWKALFDRHILAATDDCRTGILLAVETGGNHLFMGDAGIHNGTARIRIVTAAGVDRIEIIVDGCMIEAISAQEADTSYTLSAGNHYIYAKAIKDQAPASAQVTWSSPVYLQGS